MIPLEKMLSENNLSPYRRNLFAFFSIAVIVIAIYSNTFDCSWQYDDFDFFLQRSELHLTELGWDQVKGTFYLKKGENVHLYRPFSRFSLALNWYFGQENVFGYHLVNVSIHIVASIFLFLFMFQLLNLPVLRSGYGSDAYFIALLAAIFWSINPVQTQAVTYIYQRMASMAGMFQIIAMFFYIKGRTSRTGPISVGWYAGCGLSALLAFGSKENAAMLPVSILLLDLFFIQGISATNVRKSGYILLILFIVPAFLGFLFYGPSLFDPGSLFSYGSHRPFNWVERLLTEPRIILYYITLLFYPIPQRLSIFHDTTISRSLIDPPTTILSILGILAILAVCIWQAKRRPLITYCIAFFFLNHLIEGSVIGLELFNEHRNYLPSILLFVPVAIMIIRGVTFFSHRQSMQILIAAFTVLVLVCFAHGTYVRNFAWKTGLTLWSDAVQKAPQGALPHEALGYYYAKHKQFNKAIAEFEQCLSKPALKNKIVHFACYYKLGEIFRSQGKFDKALGYYKKASERRNSFAGAALNAMGRIYGKSNQLEESEKAFR